MDVRSWSEWIAKMKDGRTHLAYRPEHAMDLDTRAVVTAELHAADQGDTATLPVTLASAERTTSRGCGSGTDATRSG